MASALVWKIEYISYLWVYCIGGSKHIHTHTQWTCIYLYTSVICYKCSVDSTNRTGAACWNNTWQTFSAFTSNAIFSHSLQYHQRRHIVAIFTRVLCETQKKIFVFHLESGQISLIIWRCHPSFQVRNLTNDFQF